DGAFNKPEFKVGDPTITGDEAAVPFTWTATYAGDAMSRNATLKMKRIDGVWMVADTNGYGSLIAGELSFDSRTADSGEWHLIPGRGAVRAVDGVPQWEKPVSSGAKSAQPTSQPAQLQQPIQETSQQT